MLKKYLELITCIKKYIKDKGKIILKKSKPHSRCSVSNSLNYAAASAEAASLVNGLLSEYPYRRENKYKR